MLNKIRNNDGFTLIELMIVVVIIGILAAIAIPRFTAVSDQARRAEAEPILKQICTLAEADQLADDAGAWAATIDDIPGWDDPLGQFTMAFAGGSATATSATLGTATMNCTTKDITWVDPA